MITEYTFLAKQPILYAGQEIHAFELFFREAESAVAEEYESLIQATSRVLFNLLSTFGIEKMVKNHRAFINIDPKTLESSIIDGLDSSKFVFEISGYEQNLDDLFKNRIKSLKEKGYQFAIDKFILSDKNIQKFKDIIPLVDYLKIDISLNDMSVLQLKIPKLKELSCQLVAEKVETREEFGQCIKVGFDLFQGHFFKKPEIMRGKNVDPDRMAVMDMLKFLKVNTDTDKIVAAFEKHADLSINLLRFINSASIYTRNRIASIRQAVTLIGRSKLTQWLFLMLYAKKGVQLDANPLYVTASQRARLMEILSPKIFSEVDKNSQELVYFAGMLSVVDALFQMPMQTILDELNIASEIKSIILEYQGPIGKLLRFVIMAEKMENQDVNPQMAGLNITRNDYLQAVLESFEWNDV